MNEQLDRIEKKLADFEIKIDAIHKSSERTRKAFMWTLIITVALIVLPLLALPAMIPLFMQSLVLPAGF